MTNFETMMNELADARAQEYAEMTAAEWEAMEEEAKAN